MLFTHYFTTKKRSYHRLLTSLVDRNCSSDMTARPCPLHAALSCTARSCAPDPGTRTQQWSVIRVSSASRRGSDLLSQWTHEVVTTARTLWWTSRYQGIMMWWYTFYQQQTRKTRPAFSTLTWVKRIPILYHVFNYWCVLLGIKWDTSKSNNYKLRCGISIRHNDVSIRNTLFTIRHKCRAPDELPKVTGLNLWKRLPQFKGKRARPYN